MPVFCSYDRLLGDFFWKIFCVVEIASSYRLLFLLVWRKTWCVIFFIVQIYFFFGKRSSSDDIDFSRRRHQFDKKNEVTFYILRYFLIFHLPLCFCKNPHSTPRRNAALIKRYSDSSAFKYFLIAGKLKPSLRASCNNSILNA